MEKDETQQLWRAESSEQAKRVAVQFLQIESEIALTFSGIALTANNGEKRIRAAQTARKAYETIMRLRQRFQLTDAENHILDANLQRVQSELQSLGSSGC